MRRALTTTAAILATLSQGGCVERFMVIRTEPPGATVTLDDEKVGVTPCEIKYVWYGTREVVVELRGRRPVRALVPLDPPWWQYFPLDFVTDVLLPFTITDRREFSWTLEATPPSEAEAEEVLRRAEELRRRADAPPR